MLGYVWLVVAIPAGVLVGSLGMAALERVTLGVTPPRAREASPRSPSQGLHDDQCDPGPLSSW
jgi:hypothetical protein